MKNQRWKIYFGLSLLVLAACVAILFRWFWITPVERVNLVTDLRLSDGESLEVYGNYNSPSISYVLDRDLSPDESDSGSVMWVDADSVSYAELNRFYLRDHIDEKDLFSSGVRGKTVWRAIRIKALGKTEILIFQDI